MTADADLIQGSDEWKIARCGSLGASTLYEALARTKSGWGAGRDNKKAELVLERITGQPREIFKSAAMEMGNEREPAARLAYHLYSGNHVVDVVGLCRHPHIIGAHASPDGLVGDDGLLEIKCPQPAAHMDTLVRGVIPQKYQYQMLWEMACTGRQWCDYVSYNPDFPGRLSLWISRCKRDQAKIEWLETQVTTFLKEVDAAEMEMLHLSEGPMPLRSKSFTETFADVMWVDKAEKKPT